MLVSKWAEGREECQIARLKRAEERPAKAKDKSARKTR